ncbi:MAG TPA: glycosyltransferase [bacterium]|nr:glycosyltransferase [bacterium]
MDETSGRCAPLVSIIIAVYNSEQYVARAIESALNQTMKEVEVIVADDGSSDGTPGVLRRYEGQIKIIRQENKGPSAARNAGIKASQGKYICFLDSDDWFLPHKCELQARYLDKHPDVGLCYGPGRLVNGQTHEMVSNLSANVLEGLALRCPFLVNCPMVRREYLEKVGYFDEELRCSEDWDLWVRLYTAGCRFGSSGPGAVATSTLRQGSLSRDPAITLRSGMRMLDKYFAQLGDRAPKWLEPAARSRAWVTAGAGYLRLGKTAEARKAFSEAVVADGEALTRARNWALILRHLDPSFPHHYPDGLPDYWKTWEEGSSLVREIIPKEQIGASGVARELSAFAYALSGLAFSRGRSWRARCWLARAVFIKPSMLLDRSLARSTMKRIVGPVATRAVQRLLAVFRVGRLA